MPRLYPRVLFFINGTSPTAEQLETANRYGPGVSFRNALHIVEGAPIEDADAVAGDVPKQYADALPNVDNYEAIDRRMAARDPNRRTMMGREAVPYSDLNDDAKAIVNANALSRGAKPAPINERDPLPVLDRTTQSGGSPFDAIPGGAPRRDLPDSGWSTGGEGSDARTGSAGDPLAGAGPIENDKTAPKPAGGDKAPDPVKTETKPADDDAAVKAAALKAKGKNPA